MLTEQDPGNLRWKFDLAISYKKIGSVFLQQGYLNETIEAHGTSQNLFAELISQDPSNAEWAWQAHAADYIVLRGGGMSGSCHEGCRELGGSITSNH